VEALGLNQTTLLNDCLFENYSVCAHYIDDDLEKTSTFLDTLSMQDIYTQRAHRT